MVLEWKHVHEEKIRILGSEKVFLNFESMASYVTVLLEENKGVWSAFGPKSETAQNNPLSNLHDLWLLKRLDTIIPNNRKILNSIRVNSRLLNTAQTKAFGLFNAHAVSYEQHVHNRLDDYPLFPKEFELEFKNAK